MRPMRKEKIISSIVLLIFLVSVVSAASVPIKTMSPVATIQVVDAQQKAALIAQEEPSVSIDVSVLSTKKVSSAKTARDIIRGKKKRLITEPSVTVDRFFRDQTSNNILPPPPPGDGNCVAPVDADDVMDDVPQLLWGEYEPVPATIDEDFSIRVCAADDLGVDRIRVRLSSYYDTEMECDGARQCVRTFVVSHPVPGAFDYRVYAYDTMDNMYFDTLPVVISLPPCEDEDGDGVCDMNENPACVGENAGNLPAGSACLSYVLEAGCHVARFDGGLTVCDESAGVEYVCVDGVDVGDDVYRQSLRRYCGVGTGVCNGVFESVGDFAVVDACTMQMACVAGEAECLPRLLPPVIEPVGDRTVTEGETLVIDVDAFDPNEEVLEYGVEAPFGGIDSASGVFSYVTGSGDAGEYTLTFSVTDGSFVESETVTVTVVDGSPPSITGVVVSPETAYTNAVITCTPSGWSSSTGALPSYRYRWLDDGVVVADQTGDTFDCGSVAGCDKHDEISCEVTPVNSNGDGTPGTGSVTIRNSLPLMAGSVIVPAMPDTMDDLVCSCGGVEDADEGDLLSCSFTEVSRNSVVYAAGTDDVVLPASVTVRDDVVLCRARASDGEEETAVASSSVTVGNALPTLEEVIAWGWIDSTDPFTFIGYLGEESLLDVDTHDPDWDFPVSVACSGQDAYEVSECRYNFDDVISGPKPAECDSHPDSGCYGITANAGPLMVHVNANDGAGGESVTPVSVDVQLRYLPPTISTSNLEVTEGDPVTCPCFGLDPDGGSITERYCTEPFDGPGDLTDYYTALYADVGQTFEGVCTLTDDEGNRASGTYEITVNEASYDITLFSRLRNLSISANQSKSLEAEVTRSLLNHNELWNFVGGNPACTATICVNIDTLNDISDYFFNFDNEISEDEQIYIYGTDWPVLMDNSGFPDANTEVTVVSFNITRI